MKEYLLKNQQKIAIITGYTLVFLMAFGLGRLTASRPNPPRIKVIEPTSQLNSNAEVKGLQLNSAVTSVSPSSGKSLDCRGKIKGNIGSSSKIYHVPGGAFYERTDPEACFDTEAQAQAAGFRKSKR